jgi:serine/threonine-protein kinase HipA
VAETISKLGYSPSEDLKQMFLRIALGILIHNYDDHLRNHAMIHTDYGWRLSPAFDINISFDKSNPTLPPCEKGFGIDALISSSPFFGLSQKEGEDIVSRMKSIIKENMHSLGIKASLSESTIESIGRLLSEVFA